jgi:hypothetical protein
MVFAEFPQCRARPTPSAHKVFSCTNAGSSVVHGKIELKTYETAMHLVWILESLSGHRSRARLHRHQQHRKDHLQPTPQRLSPAESTKIGLPCAWEDVGRMGAKGAWSSSTRLDSISTSSLISHRPKHCGHTPWQVKTPTSGASPHTPTPIPRPSPTECSWILTTATSEKGHKCQPRGAVRPQ